MKEAYVSFEVAELLKEKGFDWDCNAIYGRRGEFQRNTDRAFNNGGLHVTSAPTHQMACAWLNEVHHIFIEIGKSIDLNGNYHYSYTILDKECKYVRRGYTSFDWKSEDAVEAALKYVLENL